MAVVTNHPVYSNHLHGVVFGLNSPVSAGCSGSDLPGLSPRDLYLRRKEVKSVNLACYQAKRSSERHSRIRSVRRSARARIYDSEEGAALARSSARLPSDSDRYRHTKLPRLEREEAFRVPKTVQLSDYIADESELYRLGLLYDDDEQHVRGSGFNLECIVRPDPVFAVRPSKRARGSRWEKLHMVSDCLPLELSFSSLGGDEDIARFLAPVETEVSIPDEDATLSRAHHNDGVVRSAHWPASLHVIYELLESSRHSLEPAPTEEDIPEVMAHSEGEEEVDNEEAEEETEAENDIKEEEEDECEEDCSDWGFISSIFDGEDSNTDAVIEDGAASAAEAWVVLGET